MHSSEDAAPEGAMTGRSRRRILPAIVLLALMLACAWLSANALGRTLAPGRPAGGDVIQGNVDLGPVSFVSDPAPTDRPAPADPAPGGPIVFVPPPANPTALSADGADVEPQTTPESPTATPETPTATPETPTATPETPTATPETPTATPETPTPTPVTPTPTPVCSGSVTDSYEADNTFAQAGVISTDGVPQCHVNTSPVSEEDWVKFEAVNGHDFEIRTKLLNDINQSDAAANDTLLYLYDTDGTTRLADNDDVGYTTWYMGWYYYRESLINWTAPSDGWYYVRELQWGPTAGNPIRDYHWYELWVLDLDAPPSEPLVEIPAAPEAMSPTTETPTEEPEVATETPTEEPEAPTETPTPGP